MIKSEVAALTRKKWAEMTGEELNRKLERLMHEDPSELEVRQMWADRHRLERLIALRDETYPDEDMPLDQTDDQLWRAKLRAEMTSLTGVLDGMMICRENSLILPDWLSSYSIHFLAVLARPDSDDGYKEIRSHFKAESKKLKVQKRASIVAALIARADHFDVIPNDEGMFGRFHYPEEINRAITNRRILENPVVSNIRDASELASVCLQGTWAEAKPETIRSDYQNSQINLKSLLGVSDLTQRQAVFLGWDVTFVRPDTLQILGLDIAN